ncbi:MAG TPA: VIT family protein [Rhizomicrobium sp.]
MPASRHQERHHIERSGWLRAAVLGANDGVISTASLMLGVATATQSSSSILVAGVSGLVAGALSMAAGEYVSVSSQSDVERSDIAVERRELQQDEEAELRELTGIYVKRGLEPKLAEEVARQLSARDALAAHARDELGISKQLRARPLQAAIASALSFAAGALVPVLTAWIAPHAWNVEAIYGASAIALAGLGAAGAWFGGAPTLPAVMRVTIWGLIAMAITAGIGTLFHVKV